MVPIIINIFILFYLRSFFLVGLYDFSMTINSWFEGFGRVLGKNLGSENPISQTKQDFIIIVIVADI